MGSGLPHFITFSVYHRRALLSSPAAKQIVISQLGKLVASGKIKVAGFVIMPDHVHAVLWSEDDSNLPAVLRVWKSTSAHWLRKHYENANPEVIKHLKTKRSGREVVCFWQRRYYDHNPRSHDKIREKIDYMHYSPVKKGLCERPEDYLWSSARWYLLGKNVGVKIDPGL